MRFGNRRWLLAGLACVLASSATVWTSAWVGGVPAFGQDGRRVAQQSFTLTASTLTLTGAEYHGVTEVRTRNGRKSAMHFTATGVKITDLVQTAHIDGGTMRLAAEPETTSAVRDGTIELYTERLSGRLAGVPVEFTPDSPPPLALPAMKFTDVTVENAALRGGTLRIPGVDLAVK